MPLRDSQGVLKMKKVILNNGLVVITRNIPDEYVSLHLNVGFGSYQEAQGVFDYDNGSLIGAHHFIGHLVFGDTRRYSSKEIAELDSLCEEANEEEGTITTDYWVNLFSPQDLDHVLSVLTSILFGAMFKVEELEIEKDIILSEIRIAKDNVTDMSENSFLKDLFCRTMYQKHPFRFPVLGTEENVRNLERKVLFDLYQRYYIPNNMILCITGGIDEEGTIDMIKKCFGRYEKGIIPELKSSAEPERKEPQEVPFEARSIEQNYLILGVRTIPQVHTNFYILEVIDDLLGGGSYSRLFKEIRKKMGLAYNPETKYSSVTDEGYFRVYSQAPPTQEGVESVKQIILNNLERLAQESITKEELNLSKKSLIGNHERVLRDPSDLADDLSWYELIGMGAEAYDNYPNKINAVTSADIQRFARERLNTNAYVLVGVKPRGF